MNTEQILAVLISERDKLNRAIEALGGSMPKRRGRSPGTRNTPAVAQAAAPAKPKRKLSAASRRAMVAAAKKRWALIKAGKLLRRLGSGQNVRRRRRFTVARRSS